MNLQHQPLPCSLLTPASSTGISLKLDMGLCILQVRESQALLLSMRIQRSKVLHCSPLHLQTMRRLRAKLRASTSLLCSHVFQQVDRAASRMHPSPTHLKAGRYLFKTEAEAWADLAEDPMPSAPAPLQMGDMPPFWWQMVLQAKSRMQQMLVHQPPQLVHSLHCLSDMQMPDLSLLQPTNSIHPQLDLLKPRSQMSQAAGQGQPAVRLAAWLSRHCKAPWAGAQAQRAQPRRMPTAATRHQQLLRLHRQLHLSSSLLVHSLLGLISWIPMQPLAPGQADQAREMLAQAD